MSRTSAFGHQVVRLASDVIDRYDRFGRICATGRCSQLPTHATSWLYVTGRSGRLSTAGRHVCERHAAAFAAKHTLAIGDPIPAADGTALSDGVSGWTGGAARAVRVYRTPGRQWYVEEDRGGPLGCIQRWLPGLSNTGSLQDAIRQAETLLAHTAELVPDGPWQIVPPQVAPSQASPAPGRVGSGMGAGQARVAVITAGRHPRWAGRPWQATVACAEDGMWCLTRRLDEMFQDRLDALGDHRMTLARAVGAADGLLAGQQWMPGGPWQYDGETATRQVWHPGQRPGIAGPAPGDSLPGGTGAR